MLPALVCSYDIPIQVLPPGVHWASLEEVEERFAFNQTRKGAFDRILVVASELANAGCRSIYIGGNFVTDRSAAVDFKIGWEPKFVDAAKLHPLLLGADKRARISRYGGDVVVVMSKAECGQAWLEYLQTDPITGERKGILGVVLTSGLH